VFGEVMKPHKHAELIKAWADGAEIQVLDNHMEWHDIGDYTSWHEQSIYRIKPTPIKLDIVVLRHLKFWRDNLLDDPNEEPNIKFVFDGETRKVKSAEVLK
jgi:hypothetical protein